MPLDMNYPAPPMKPGLNMPMGVNSAMGMAPNPPSGVPGSPEEGAPQQQPYLMLPTATPQMPVTPGPVGQYGGAVGQPAYDPTADAGNVPPAPIGQPGPPGPMGAASPNPTPNLDPQTLMRILGGGA